MPTPQALMGRFQNRDGSDIFQVVGKEGDLECGMNAAGVMYTSVNLPVNFVALSSKVLFVDGSRVDIYVADGTILKPYKTISAAVNKIISNGDNSPTHPYCIYILAPGTYNETVDLSNTAIVNLTIEGPGIGFGSGAAVIPALQSTANNDQQQFLCFKNLNIGTVTMTGASNGTNFCANDLEFLFCQIGNNASFTNCGGPSFLTCTLLGQVSLVNVANGYIDASSVESAPLSVITQAGNMPSGIIGATFLLVENSRVSANISLSGSGTTLQALFSTLGRLDGSTTITNPAGTNLITKACYVRGTFVA